MFHFRSFSFLFGIISLSIILAKAAPAQGNDGPVRKPVLSRIIVNGDSIINPLSESPGKDILHKKPFVLSFRDNNIVFEYKPADDFEFQYFLAGFDK